MGDDDSETNNYFLIDGKRMKQAVKWYQRIPYEANFIRDFDTFQKKWSGYERYSYGVGDWRWVVGANVT